MHIKNKLKTNLAALIILASFVTAPLLPATQASAAACKPPEGFSLLPAWYKGLECSAPKGVKGGKETISPPAEQGGLQAMIIKIVLNVLEALFYIVGYVSLALIIWGGFKYMLFGDNPGGMESAKKTIQNAVIGLVISIFAVVIVNVITGAF